MVDIYICCKSHHLYIYIYREREREEKHPVRMVQRSQQHPCRIQRQRHHQEEPHRPVSAPSPQLHSSVVGPLLLGGVIAGAGCVARSHSSHVLSSLFSQTHSDAFSTVCWRAHFNLLSSAAEKPKRCLKMFNSFRSIKPRAPTARW